jgi:sortase (surface protein transpeptidase)
VTPPARFANVNHTSSPGTPGPATAPPLPSPLASLTPPTTPADRAPAAVALPESTSAAMSEETATPSPQPEATAVAIPTVTPAPLHAVPVRVMIPRIGVNARVIPVGTAPDGAMDSPNNPVDVGWWGPGARPGDFGSAVLGGHVDFAGYGAAVFWNLKLLQPGDQIRVVEADNTQLLFSVNDVETYSYSDTSVIDRIFRTEDRQGLNVITCTGTFDARTHNYDKRVVVYASLAGS